MRFFPEHRQWWSRRHWTLETKTETNTFRFLEVQDWDETEKHIETVFETEPTCLIPVNAFTVHIVQMRVWTSALWLTVSCITYCTAMRTFSENFFFLLCLHTLSMLQMKKKHEMNHAFDGQAEVRSCAIYQCQNRICPWPDFLPSPDHSLINYLYCGPDRSFVWLARK